MMRPILLPLILTLISFACATLHYEEGFATKSKRESKIKKFLFLDFNKDKNDVPEHFLSASEEFEGEGESDEDSDSLMRMAGMVKSGQNQGANVTCMRWTSRLVTVGNIMTQTQSNHDQLFLLSCKY